MLFAAPRVRSASRRAAGQTQRPSACSAAVRLTVVCFCCSDRSWPLCSDGPERPNRRFGPFWPHGFSWNDAAILQCGSHAAIEPASSTWHSTAEETPGEGHHRLAACLWRRSFRRCSSSRLS